jgi:hypothetical protein
MHEQKHTITEFIEYPDHEARTESAEFRKNKRILVKQLDLPCWTCGSRDHREVHHLHEWALWGALDAEKVLDTLHQFDPYGFTHKMGEQPIESPDDIRNLLVLCGHHTTLAGEEIPGGHHRGVDLGIHDLTFPIWLALHSAKDGVELTKAVSHVKAKDAELKGTHQK